LHEGINEVNMNELKSCSVGANDTMLSECRRGEIDEVMYYIKIY